MNRSPTPTELHIGERVTAMEMQGAATFRAQAAGKDWRSTVGTVKDDEFSREADRLGEEWRKSVTD